MKEGDAARMRERRHFSPQRSPFAIAFLTSHSESMEERMVPSPDEAKERARPTPSFPLKVDILPVMFCEPFLYNLTVCLQCYSLMT